MGGSDGHACSGRSALQHGWAGADVRGQIGSLAGGRLAQPDGSGLDVDGPATEVMFLDGQVRAVGGKMTADLDAHLVDRHAGVHSGRLVPGRNPVAMTYELVLTRACPSRMPPTAKSEPTTTAPPTSGPPPTATASG